MTDNLTREQIERFRDDCENSMVEEVCDFALARDDRVKELEEEVVALRAEVQKLRDHIALSARMKERQ